MHLTFGYHFGVSLGFGEGGKIGAVLAFTVDQGSFFFWADEDSMCFPLVWRSVLCSCWDCVSFS